MVGVVGVIRRGKECICNFYFSDRLSITWRIGVSPRRASASRPIQPRDTGCMPVTKGTFVSINFIIGCL